VRLAFKDGKVAGEECLLLESSQRVRDVKHGPVVRCGRSRTSGTAA